MSFELVLAALGALEKLWDFVQKQRAIAAANSEWTPEQRQLISERSAALRALPEWQPDPGTE